MRKIVLLGIVLIMVMTVFAGCTEENGNGNGEELEEAPDFELTDVDGDTFKLSDFEGDVVILDFMFIECPPCVKEMEHLDDVSDNYNSNDVKIISIDAMYYTENETQLRDFRDNNGYDWIFAMDTDEEDAHKKYEANQFPTLFIINKKGEIAYEKAGESTYEVLSKEIDKLL
jgi:cytochrome c-type biogenesis protein